LNLGEVAVYICVRLFASFLLIAFLSQTWGMLMAGPFSPVAYLLLAAAVPGVELIFLPIFAIFDELP